jgi:hypothetical protein
MHYETRCADRLKVLWWDGTGLCLYASGSSEAGSSGR